MPMPAPSQPERHAESAPTLGAVMMQTGEF